MKHLSGENFAAIADCTYEPGRSVPDSGIVFCHVNNVTATFNALRDKSGSYVLISSQGDFTTVQKFIDTIPRNIIKWFSVGAIPSNGLTQGIPLGIADSQYNTKPFNGGQWHLVEIERNTTREIKGLLHARMCLGTNREREVAYNMLNGHDWATMSVFYDFHEKPLSFQQYLEELHHYKFTLAPNGGGVDTHRIWEALYLDVIPICRRQNVLLWFEELPICWIDTWDEITEDMLNREYDRIKSTDWKMDMLWMDYWKRLIRGSLS